MNEHSPYSTERTIVIGLQSAGFSMTDALALTRKLKEEARNLVLRDRRERIATAAFASLDSGHQSPVMICKRAVEIADELISQLDKQPTSPKE
ncbi:hypothetical protein WS67_12070 [Burkholderia singularis]|uniref:Uncharacterized protein n=1 Tax=Burkholderia singularis TaxID=1503053 RepID=A0A124P931_9BURK|nr:MULTISPECIES: hypothetical protein [Burkholderia]KVE27232.1 hypothetical protein WS67_12070 [Burkholderia singularis]KVE33726.1 hypothetical protein WS68_11165 [Burkholderia sp. TSV86]